MKRKITFAVLILVAIFWATEIGGLGLAQTSSSYNLEWYVIGGGGRPASSANYAVNSTAGQSVASPPYLVNVNDIVSGGYWFPATYLIFLPVTVKSH